VTIVTHKVHLVLVILVAIFIHADQVAEFQLICPANTENFSDKLTGKDQLTRITQLIMKKVLREMQTLRASCSKAKPKIFAPLQTPSTGRRTAKI